MDTASLGGLPLAPRARGAVEAALREARERGHQFLGTEHLLLGMLAEPDAVATRILARLGVADRLHDELVAVFEAPGYPSAGPPPMSPITDWELRHELLHRRRRDQELRRRLGASTAGAGGVQSPEAQALMEELREQDRDNTEWLRAVVRTRGWPGRSAVGDEGAAAAWLLAQHADGDPVFQRECLVLLEQAAELREALAEQVAYLTDRVLLAEGRAQRYGTQFRPRPDGEPEPAPLEDPDHVDERRASVGLEPLAAEQERMRQLHRRPDA